MRLRGLKAAVLVTLLLGASVAEAHRFEVRRSLALEPFGPTLHVVATVQVPSGQHTQTVIALADANRDGRLSKGEQKLVEDTLIQRALYGIELWEGDKRLRLDEVQSKLKMEKSGGMTLMLYGHTALSAARTQVEVRTQPSAQALDLVVVSGLVESSRGRIDRGTLRVRLRAADQIRLALASVAPEGGEQPAGSQAHDPEVIEPTDHGGDVRDQVGRDR